MNFNELFELAYSQNLRGDPRNFVKFYDQNRILIEGQNISRSDIIYDRVTRMTTDYALCLTHNNSYTKAKPEIEKALILFENHPTYKDQDLLRIKFYELLVFDRAVVNYYSKNYKEAIEDLDRLSNKFPNDEKFKDWLNAAKSYKLKKFENLFYVVFTIVIFTSIFLDDFNQILDTIITALLVVCLLTLGSIEFVKWRRKK